MKIGLVGTGKMGYNLAQNMLSKGHEVVVYDVNSVNMQGLADKGAHIAVSLEDLVKKLPGEKVIFLMVPVGKPVDDTIAELRTHLTAGDIIIDGGNSHYKDSKERYLSLKKEDINFVDCGTSGGVNGALHGVCVMVGGEPSVFSICEPLFKDIAVENGYLYTGAPGSGHFCKMIHNGIEYGMMQAIAEGFELLQKSEYPFDLEKVAGVWNHGSVVRSWLMELLESALQEDGKLESIRGIMKSTGEGKWTLEHALEHSVCAPVIALSLLMRYRSLEEDTFAGKIVAVLRNQFGGHQVEQRKNS